MDRSESASLALTLLTLIGLALSVACGPVAIANLGSSGGGSGGKGAVVLETFLSGPSDFSNTDSVEFEFSSNAAKAKFQGRLDCKGCEGDGGWFPVTSPYLTEGILTEGAHVFEVRSVLGANNMDESPTSIAWTVDRTPPEPPSSLLIDLEETTILSLAWTSAADALSGVEGYRVYYENIDSTALPETANEGASGFSVGLLNGLFLSGLQPCNELRIWVTAVDRAGNESALEGGSQPVQKTWCGWDGTFTEVAMLPIGAPPENLIVHDFSGDGVVDLAVQTAQDVRLLDGDGDGSFLERVPPFDVGERPIAITTGDFNGDLRTDVVVLSSSRSTGSSVTVLDGACGGGLSPLGVVTTISSTQPAFCIAAAGWHSTVGNSGNSRVEEMEGDTVTDLFLGGPFGTHYLLGCKRGFSFNEDCDPSEFQSICFWGGVGDVVACATGDFDQDGREEVVAVTGAGMVAVLLTQDGGGGDIGNYCGGMDTDPPNLSFAGVGASCVEAVDLNSDGLLDLVVGNSLSTRIAVLLGNGPDIFSSPFEYEVGAASHAIALADFDADGISDLVVATDTGFAILLGNGFAGVGDGTFSPAIPGPIALPTRETRDVVARDFDGDAIPDVAVTVPSENAICILLGGGAARKGTGYFTPQNPLPLTQVGTDIFRADFNDDGILDLVVGSGDMITNVYFGNGSERRGDGTFRYGAGYFYDPGGGQKQFQREIGDFNGDGIPDLVVCSCRGQDHDNQCDRDHGGLRVRPGTGGPNGTLGAEILGSQDTRRNPIVADFDRDGFDDLAMADPYSVFRGRVSGVLRNNYRLETSAPDSASSLVAADLDGDGRLDLAATTEQGHLMLSLQRQPEGEPLPELVGQATTFLIFTLSCSVGIKPEGSAIVAEDFDGDGHVDLAVVGESPLYVLLANEPDGCSGSSVSYSIACHFEDREFTNLIAGEFSGDGVPDLVAVEDTQVVLMQGLGDGGFEEPRVILRGEHSALVTGDFNSDGALDLALTNDTATVSLLFGGAAAP